MTTEQEIINRPQGNNLNSVFWGGSLLWAGLIFGLDSFGNLPRFGAASSWSWIFLGMGAYGLVLNSIRQFSSNYSHPSAWDWVWGIIFLVIGAAGFAAISVPWWLFLILIGAVILGNAILQSRRD